MPSQVLGKFGTFGTRIILDLGYDPPSSTAFEKAPLAKKAEQLEEN
jgi:hypothetical protein